MGTCNCGSTIVITPNCSPRPVVCCQPEVTVETYTFENANVTGIGVFDNETSNTVQFRGLVSASDGLTITLNAGNKVLTLALDMTELVADIPDATTSQRGVLETATDAEALSKAATDKILTPSNLAAIGSTTTFAGLVELATNAETISGLSATLAVTPAGLAAQAATQKTTQTFADAVARNAATPAFEAQYGGQQDNGTAWIGTATSAGSWIQIPSTDNNFTISDTGTPAWTIVTGLTIDGATQNGTIAFEEFAQFTFNNILDISIANSPVTFSNEAVRFSASNINIDSASRIFDAGVIVPANSVLTTSSIAGQLNSSLISTFLSTANTQTGWSVTNPSVTRTLDVAAADLATTRAVLGTLINDLKAVLLPAT